MGQISFSVSNSIWKWSGTCIINYDVSYDNESNLTTVTFATSIFNYFGRSEYGTSATASITATPTDNTSGKKSSTLSTYGTTTGGSQDFMADPSPKQLILKHGDDDGEKKITFDVSAVVTAYMTSTATSQTQGTGSTTATVSVGTHETTKARIKTANGILKAIPYIAVQNGSSLVWKKAKIYEFGTVPTPPGPDPEPSNVLTIKKTNLHDSAQDEAECYYNGEGKRMPYSAWSATGLIPIVSGKKYAIVSPESIDPTYIQLYDSSGNYSEGYVGQAITLGNNNNITSYLVFKSTVTGYLRFSGTKTAVAALEMYEADDNLVVGTTNLHNSASDMADKYYDMHGQITAYTTWTATDKIPIENGKIYALNLYNAVAKIAGSWTPIFDSTGSFVKACMGGLGAFTKFADRNTYFVAPNDGYIAFSGDSRIMTDLTMYECTGSIVKET